MAITAMQQEPAVQVEHRWMYEHPPPPQFWPSAPSATHTLACVTDLPLCAPPCVFPHRLYVCPVGQVLHVVEGHPGEDAAAEAEQADAVRLIPPAGCRNMGGLCVLGGGERG